MTQVAPSGVGPSSQAEAGQASLLLLARLPGCFGVLLEKAGAAMVSRDS